jgi:hypothetical protein
VARNSCRSRLFSSVQGTSPLTSFGQSVAGKSHNRTSGNDLSRNRVNQELAPCGLRRPLLFIWKASLSLPSKNQANEPLAHSKRRRAAVARPSAHLGCRRQLHPIEHLYGCSNSALAALRQTQSCAPIALQLGGSYPSTAQPLGQTAAPTRPCPDWNSPLAGLVPTPQKHGCADLYFALEHLQLRKTPADMLVTWEKATERCALLQMPH